MYSSKQFHDRALTLRLPNKLSSAKFLVCFNFKSALMLHKFGDYFVYWSNSLDPDEMPNYLASHPDTSCLHIAPWMCLAGLGLTTLAISFLSNAQKQGESNFL